MDIATIIGLILGTGLVLTSIAMGGGGLMPFIDVPSGMIVFGGAISALLINFPLGTVLGPAGVVKNCFMTKLPTSNEVIDKFKDLATIARKDGLLAIENSLEDVTDPFLLRGLEMVTGGSEKDDIRDVLETEISYIAERHTSGKKLLEAMAAAAPAFGMIGTLIGLVQMLRSLDDPSKIGGGMATALLTTLYGAMTANMFCLPLAGKLEERNKMEILVRELMLAGILSLVDGQTPRSVQERLVVFVPPKERPDDDEKTAA
jgi:chemotaxis protein MotA